MARKTLIAFLGILLLASVARAATYDFIPLPPDFYDMPHTRYYSWGLDWTLPADEYIESVYLYAYAIDDSRTEPDDRLYITLLDPAVSVPAGVSTYIDVYHGLNDWEGWGTLLAVWTDGDATDGYDGPSPDDLVFNFTSPFRSLLSDPDYTGSFGLGLDPDCYYMNNGFQLTINTVPRPVPEPRTLLLLGFGLLLAGVLGRRRFFHL